VKIRQVNLGVVVWVDDMVPVMDGAGFCGKHPNGDAHEEP
jgi:hypothetical protein